MAIYLLFIDFHELSQLTNLWRHSACCSLLQQPIYKKPSYENTNRISTMAYYEFFRGVGRVDKDSWAAYADLHYALAGFFIGLVFYLSQFVPPMIYWILNCFTSSLRNIVAVGSDEEEEELIVTEESEEAIVQDQVKSLKHGLFVLYSNGEATRIACKKGGTTTVHDVTNMDSSQFLIYKFTKEDDTYLYSLETQVTNDFFFFKRCEADGSVSAFVYGDVNWDLIGWAARSPFESFPVFVMEILLGMDLTAHWGWGFYYQQSNDPDLVDLAPIIQDFDPSKRLPRGMSRMCSSATNQSFFNGASIGSKEMDSGYQVSRKSRIDSDHSLLVGLAQAGMGKERKRRCYISNLKVFLVWLFLLGAIVLGAIGLLREFVPCSAVPTLCGFGKVWRPPAGWYQCKTYECSEYPYAPGSAQEDWYRCQDVTECEEIFRSSPYYTEDWSPYFNKSFAQIDNPFVSYFSRVPFALEYSEEIKTFWRHCDFSKDCDTYYDMLCGDNLSWNMESLFGAASCTKRYMDSDYQNISSPFFHRPFSAVFPGKCVKSYFWQDDCFDHDRDCCNSEVCSIEYQYIEQSNR